MPPAHLSTVDVKAELLRLRRGHALAHPNVVLNLSPLLRRHLLANTPHHGDTTSQISALLTILREAIDATSPNDRAVLEAGFNLATEHTAATLTERQHSLATARQVSYRTITRAADKALETLAFGLATLHRDDPPTDRSKPAATTETGNSRQWRNELSKFWRLNPDAHIDVVCSEAFAEDRSPLASPNSRKYARYAKYVDLDSLVYLRTCLAGLNGEALVRDYPPSEYHELHDIDRKRVLINIGNPCRNETYRNFQRDLPCQFTPPESDKDCSLLVPELNLDLSPQWSHHQELIEDLAVFSRLTLARGLTVFLLGGCLTLGALVATQTFLYRELGARNARHISNQVGDDDFLLIIEARRYGEITDVPDLTTTEPLVLMSRTKGNSFMVLINNSNRYIKTKK
jgi:hypothetical protein